MLQCNSPHRSFGFICLYALQVGCTHRNEVFFALRDLRCFFRSVDVLAQCLQAKAEGRVFSIVFLGINGVGKSTNLAKVAYHLKHVSFIF